jgi:hypothetical protein
MKKLLVTSILALLLCVTSFVFSQNNSSKQKLIGTFHRYYEPSMKAWQGMDSFAFTYDKQGNKNTVTQFSGDDSLYPIVKGIYTFNPKNQIYTQENYLWDFTSKSWSNTPSSKSTFTYNNVDSLITILTETLDSITWVNNSKTEFTYDGNNNRIQELNFIWDTLTKSWSNANCQKTTMTYNANKCSSKMYYIWNTNSKQFDQTTNFIYTYNTKGKLETTINQVWDGVNAWHNSTKDSVVYDKNNIKTEEYGFNFDDGKTKSWLLAFKYTNSINSNNQIDQTLLTTWNTKTNSFPIDENARQITFNYNKYNNLKTIFDKRFDTISKQFVDYNEDYFYYTSDTMTMVSVTSLDVNTYIVYPNPFINQVTIKTPVELALNTKISLTNSIGEQMHFDLEKHTNELKLFTNNLAKGIYYLHIENSESIYLTKIVKI